MSIKWSCPQISCIVVEKEGEAQNSEWEGSSEKTVEALKCTHSSSPTILPNTHWSFCSLLWKLTFFLGVLSSLVYLFPLLGAPPWPPPKCLLQMFIFINVAYTGQEIGKGWAWVIYKSTLALCSGNHFHIGRPGQSALILTPFIPTSKQKPLQFLFTVRCFMEFWAKSLLSWKASSGLQHSILTCNKNTFLFDTNK